MNRSQLLLTGVILLGFFSGCAKKEVNPYGENNGRIIFSKETLESLHIYLDGEFYDSIYVNPWDYNQLPDCENPDASGVAFTGHFGWKMLDIYNEARNKHWQQKFLVKEETCNQIVISDTSSFLLGGIESTWQVPEGIDSLTSYHFEDYITSADNTIYLSSQATTSDTVSIWFNGRKIWDRDTYSGFRQFHSNRYRPLFQYGGNHFVIECHHAADGQAFRAKINFSDKHFYQMVVPEGRKGAIVYIWDQY